MECANIINDTRSSKQNISDVFYSTFTESKSNTKAKGVLKIIEGPFKMLAGKITELDIEAGKANVSIDLFGQETNVELALTDFTKE